MRAMDDFTLHERSGRFLADLMSATGEEPARSYTPDQVRALWPQADAMARGEERVVGATRGRQTGMFGGGR